MKNKGDGGGLLSIVSHLRWMNPDKFASIGYAKLRKMKTTEISLEEAMLRIGMLTSGGDCQGLNAAMRGVAKTLFEGREDVEIFGYLDGYKGLMNGDFRKMYNSDFSGILNLGGTILGTSRMPFKEINEQADPDSNYDETRLEAMVRNYKMQKLDCLVSLGGNGSLKTANALREAGCNVIALPKTIDNDIYGTELTFGFISAAGVATDVIDGIHTTATSHGRIFIIELMGHKVGWLALYAGIAGGADVILIPEIPYNLDSIVNALNRRSAERKRFSIIVMAEGAISQEDAKLSKEEARERIANSKFPSVTYELAHQLEERMGQEVRVTVPGHYQRGGNPVAYDRVYASRVGVAGAELILNQQYGYLVGLRDDELVAFPLEEVADRLKLVEPSGTLVRTARDLGLYMGDEDFSDDGMISWPEYDVLNRYDSKYSKIEDLIQRFNYRPVEKRLRVEIERGNILRDDEEEVVVDKESKEQGKED